MNILDENIEEDAADRLRSWGISAHHIGYDIGRAGMKDDEILPFLHQLRRPTLFSRDLHFYKRNLCHAYYCLVYLEVREQETPTFIRRLLRHPAFNTQVKRMGAVIRVAPSGLTVWWLHAEQEVTVPWPR